MNHARVARGIGMPLAAVLLLVGCGYDATTVPPEPKESTSSAAPAGPVECDNPTESYAPSRDAGRGIAAIKQRGRLIAGVSADTYQLGSNNPETNEIEGFDIDFARRIADELGVNLQLRVISAADRIPLLKSGAIDIVARNMTMNCARWEEIGFSAEYYHATQKVLLRKDLAENYAGPSSLEGLEVCAPVGSTSIDNIQEVEPGAQAVAANNHTGCLVRLQQGEVEAITGDDTVLAGLAAQDRVYAVVPKQEPFSDEPYGIGVKKEHVDLARFINDVLEEMRRDGSWQDSYDRWLRPYLGAATPPAPAYGR